KAMVAQRTLPDLFGVMEQRFGWRDAAFAVGRNSFVALNLRRNPEDDILPFQPASGLAGQLEHQNTFRLSGSDGAFFWNAGTGMSLQQGLMPAGDDPFITDSLTYGFLPSAGIAPAGSFASFGFTAGDTTKISFGIGQARQQGLSDVTLPYRNHSEEVALRLDEEGPGWRFSLDAGTSLNSGGFFGSVASGGLRMADQATTAWSTFTGELRLDADWAMKGRATISVAPGATPQASLITSISPVIASSFAVGLSGRNLFRNTDILLF